MRWTKAKIYDNELRKAYERGLNGYAAEREAKLSTEDIFDELVDRGRQEAKDRAFER